MRAVRYTIKTHNLFHMDKNTAENVEEVAAVEEEAPVAPESVEMAPETPSEEVAEPEQA